MTDEGTRVPDKAFLTLALSSIVDPVSLLDSPLQELPLRKTPTKSKGNETLKAGRSNLPIIDTVNDTEDKATFRLATPNCKSFANF